MSGNNFSLNNKTILVTGASSGIGRGIAILCAKMGGKIILTGRNYIKLQEPQALLDGEEHQIIAGDLTLNEDLHRVVRELPQLDGVVHCAGIGQRVLCKSISGEDIDKVMGTNFKAPVMLQAELLQEKKINKCASIIFITSIASESPSYGNALYSASKGALISYVNCLELELSPRKIRVNCISPAMVMTDLIYEGGITEDQLKEDEKKYPLKRYGQPEDIAGLAVYLLSDASMWMTGSNVKITGGVKHL